MVPFLKYCHILYMYLHVSVVGAVRWVGLQLIYSPPSFSRDSLNLALANYNVQSHVQDYVNSLTPDISSHFGKCQDKVILTGHFLMINYA